MAVENILDEQGELIAQLYTMDEFDKTAFPTPETCSFQFGIGVVKDKTTLAPHIHKLSERTINKTAEFIFVMEGEIEVDVLSEKEGLLKTISLTKNTALLQFFGGHKIIISEGTRYFELKQGPYYGKDFDKYVLDEKK